MTDPVDPYTAYRRTLGAEGAALRQAWDRISHGLPGAGEELARLLHRLHGTSGTYGFEEVSDRARELRQRIVGEGPTCVDPSAIEPLLAALRKEGGRSEPAHDAPVLDLARALEACAGDEGLRREVAEELLRSIPRDRLLLLAALDAADGLGLSRLGHRMKSSLAAAGAIEASRAAEALDQAARTGSPRVSGLAEFLLAALERASAAIGRSLRDP